tara:strand:+ start:63 stop:947 length:885 start_codon:yes stop_codon:yes gene_type:complete
MTCTSLAIMLALLLPATASALCSTADAAFKALRRHVERAGGFVGPISLSESSEGLRGLFVTEAVAAGEPLCGVPRSCVLHATAGDDLKAHERLMLQLLEARSAGDHALYLPTMPERIPLLRDWTAPQLERLQSASLLASVDSQRAWAERTLALVAERAPETTPDDLEWAERVVRSRSLATASADGEPTLQLVPIFDMCNHVATPAGAEHAPHVLVMADGVVVLCAQHDLAPGDEVRFSYRDESEGNSALLLDYGFAVPPPEHLAGAERLREERAHAAFLAYAEEEAAAIVESEV